LTTLYTVQNVMGNQDLTLYSGESRGSNAYDETGQKVGPTEAQSVIGQYLGGDDATGETMVRCYNCGGRGHKRAVCLSMPIRSQTKTARREIRKKEKSAKKRRQEDGRCGKKTRIEPQEQDKSHQKPQDTLPAAPRYNFRPLPTRLDEHSEEGYRRYLCTSPKELS
jgi:hypothetical protein